MNLLSGRWLIVHTLTLIALTVMVYLGLWQLRRLEAKRTRNASLLAALDAPVQSLATPSVDPAQLHLRRVRVTGTFDNAASMLLRGQLLDNIPGVHILTPLHMRGSDHAVIVDRGWIPLAYAQLEQLDTYAVAGEITVEGVAYRSQLPADLPLTMRDRPLAGTTRIAVWSRVDLEYMQAQVAQPLLPLYVVQLPDTHTPMATFPRRQQRITLDEGPHAGYALQWFAFAAMGLVAYGLALRKAVCGRMSMR